MNDSDVVRLRAADLYYRYAWAVDTNDLAILSELVTDDIQITRPSGQTSQGKDAFLQVYRNHQAQNIPVGQHVVSNVLAQRDGGQIRTHAYFQATFLTEAETRILYGEYHDLQVDVGKEHKILHKIIEVHRVLHLPAAVTPPSTSS